MQMSLQDGESRFRRMIESNPDGLLIVGQDGVVQFANPAAQKIFDRQSRELSGQSFGFPIVIGEMTELEIPR
jgi:PAS domain S-box-containing protein